MADPVAPKRPDAKPTPIVIAGAAYEFMRKDLRMDFDTAAKKAQEMVWADPAKHLGKDWETMPKTWEATHPASQEASKMTLQLRKVSKERMQRNQMEQGMEESAKSNYQRMGLDSQERWGLPEEEVNEDLMTDFMQEQFASGKMRPSEFHLAFQSGSSGSMEEQSRLAARKAMREWGRDKTERDSAGSELDRYKLDMLKMQESVLNEGRNRALEEHQAGIGKRSGSDILAKTRANAQARLGYTDEEADRPIEERQPGGVPQGEWREGLGSELMAGVDMGGRAPIEGSQFMEDRQGKGIAGKAIEPSTAGMGLRHANKVQQQQPGYSGSTLSSMQPTPLADDALSRIGEGYVGGVLGLAATAKKIWKEGARMVDSTDYAGEYHTGLAQGAEMEFAAMQKAVDGLGWLQKNFGVTSGTRDLGAAKGASNWAIGLTAGVPEFFGHVAQTGLDTYQTKREQGMNHYSAASTAQLAMAKAFVVDPFLHIPGTLKEMFESPAAFERAWRDRPADMFFGTAGPFLIAWHALKVGPAATLKGKIMLEDVIAKNMTAMAVGDKPFINHRLFRPLKDAFKSAESLKDVDLKAAEKERVARGKGWDGPQLEATEEVKVEAAVTEAKAADKGIEVQEERELGADTQPDIPENAIEIPDVDGTGTINMWRDEQGHTWAGSDEGKGWRADITGKDGKAMTLREQAMAIDKARAEAGWPIPKDYPMPEGERITPRQRKEIEPRRLPGQVEAKAPETPPGGEERIGNAEINQQPRPAQNYLMNHLMRVANQPWYRKHLSKRAAREAYGSLTEGAGGMGKALWIRVRDSIKAELAGEIVEPPPETAIQHAMQKGMADVYSAAEHAGHAKAIIKMIDEQMGLKSTEPKTPPGTPPPPVAPTAPQRGAGPNLPDVTREANPAAAARVEADLGGLDKGYPEDFPTDRGERIWRHVSEILANVKYMPKGKEGAKKAPNEFKVWARESLGETIAAKIDAIPKAWDDLYKQQAEMRGSIDYALDITKEAKKAYGAESDNAGEYYAQQFKSNNSAASQRLSLVQQLADFLSKPVEAGGRGKDVIKSRAAWAKVTAKDLQAFLAEWGDSTRTKLQADPAAETGRKVVQAVKAWFDYMGTAKGFPKFDGKPAKNVTTKDIKGTLQDAKSYPALLAHEASAVMGQVLGRVFEARAAKRLKSSGKGTGDAKGPGSNKLTAVYTVMQQGLSTGVRMQHLLKMKFTEAFEAQFMRTGTQKFMNEGEVRARTTTYDPNGPAPKLDISAVNQKSGQKFGTYWSADGATAMLRWLKLRKELIKDPKVAAKVAAGGDQLFFNPDTGGVLSDKYINQVMREGFRGIKIPPTEHVYFRRFRATAAVKAAEYWAGEAAKAAGFESLDKGMTSPQAADFIHKGKLAAQEILGHEASKMDNTMRYLKSWKRIEELSARRGAQSTQGISTLPEGATEATIKAAAEKNVADRKAAADAAPPPPDPNAVGRPALPAVPEVRSPAGVLLEKGRDARPAGESQTAKALRLKKAAEGTEATDADIKPDMEAADLDAPAKESFWDDGKRPLNSGGKPAASRADEGSGSPGKPAAEEGSAAHEREQAASKALEKRLLEIDMKSSEAGLSAVGEARAKRHAAELLDDWHNTAQREAAKELAEERKGEKRPVRPAKELFSDLTEALNAMLGIDTKFFRWAPKAKVWNVAKTVQGWYDAISGSINIRFREDLRTMSHETFHKIGVMLADLKGAKQIKTLRDQLDVVKDVIAPHLKELRQLSEVRLTKEMFEGPEGAAEYVRVMNELWAEFGRLFIYDNALAKRMLPDLYADFKVRMDKRFGPDAWKSLKRVSDGVDVLRDNVNWEESAISDIAQNMSDKMRSTWTIDRSIHELFDDHYGLKKVDDLLDRALALQGEKPLEAHERFYVLTRNSHGAMGTIQSFLTKNTLDFVTGEPNGLSLKEVHRRHIKSGIGQPEMYGTKLMMMKVQGAMRDIMGKEIYDPNPRLTYAEAVKFIERMQKRYPGKKNGKIFRVDMKYEKDGTLHQKLTEVKKIGKDAWNVEEWLMDGPRRYYTDIKGLDKKAMEKQGLEFREGAFYVREGSLMHHSMEYDLFSDRVLRYALDAKNIGPIQYNVMKIMNYTYLPLHRVAEGKRSALLGGALKGGFTKAETKRLASLGSGVFKRKGKSYQQIMYPLEGYMKNLERMVISADKNYNMRMFVSHFASKGKPGGVTGLGHLVEWVEPKKRPVQMPVKEAVANIRRTIDKDILEYVEQAIKLEDILKDNLTMWHTTMEVNGRKMVWVRDVNAKGELVQDLYDLDPDIYKMAMGLSKKEAHAIARTLGFFASTLRKGATVYNPGFWAKNMIRDPMTAYFFTKLPHKSIIHSYMTTAKGISHFWRNSAEYQEWMAHKGAQVTISQLERGNISEQLMLEFRGLTKEGRGSLKAKEFFAGVLSNPMELGQIFGDMQRVFHERMTPILEAYKKPGEAVEIGSRLGEYMRVKADLINAKKYKVEYADFLKEEGKGKGFDQKEYEQWLWKTGRMKNLMVDAIFQSREITLDFAKAGAQLREWGQITAFLTANLNSAYRVGTSFHTKGGRKSMAAQTMLRGIPIFGITASLYAWRMSMGKEVMDEYDSMAQYDKNMFWHFPVPTFMREAIKKATGFHIPFFKLPKPYDYGAIFGSLWERIADYHRNKNPDDLWSGFRDAALIGPGDTGFGGLMPTGFRPIVEAHWGGAGKSFFFGTPIVPRGKVGMKKNLQFTPTTSDFSRAVSNTIQKWVYPYVGFSISPAIIDNTIVGYTGGVGRALSNIGPPHLIVPSWRRNLPASQASDISLLKGFVSRIPAGTSSHLGRFYDRRETIENNYKSYRHLLMTNTPESRAQAKTIFKEWGPLMATLRYWNAVQDQNSQLRKRVTILADRNYTGDLTPRDRREQIDGLRRTMTSNAKRTEAVWKDNR